MAGKTGNTYQLSVGTTPVVVGTVGTHGNRVLHLTILSSASNSIFYGFSNTVSSTNGAILKNTNSYDVTIETAANVYAVSAAGNVVISVAEVIG